MFSAEDDVDRTGICGPKKWQGQRDDLRRTKGTKKLPTDSPFSQIESVLATSLANSLRLASSSLYSGGMTCLYEKASGPAL